MQTFITRSASAILASMLLAAPIAIADTASKASATNELPGQEYNIYRSGHPYRTGRGDTSSACQMACNGDQNCASWAYVPATFQIGPRCELKRNIGSSEYRPGAISGVSSKYYPNGTPRPAAKPPANAVVPPRSNLALYPGSENWPAPYDIPEEQRVLLGEMPRIAYRSTTSEPAMTPRPNLKPSLRPVTRAARIKPAASAEPPMKSVIAARPANTSAPKIVYQSVITRPASGPSPAAVMTGKASAASVPGVPTSPTAKLRKNWTEEGYRTRSYSVQDTDYIPGDEDALAGYLDGAPEE